MATRFLRSELPNSGTKLAWTQVDDQLISNRFTSCREEFIRKIITIETPSNRNFRSKSSDLVKFYDVGIYENLEIMNFPRDTRNLYAKQLRRKQQLRGTLEIYGFCKSRSFREKRTKKKKKNKNIGIYKVRKL